MTRLLIAAAIALALSLPASAQQADVLAAKTLAATQQQLDRAMKEQAFSMAQAAALQDEVTRLKADNDALRKNAEPPAATENKP